jgi:hypothetical protein
VEDFASGAGLAAAGLAGDGFTVADLLEVVLDAVAFAGLVAVAVDFGDSVAREEEDPFTAFTGVLDAFFSAAAFLADAGLDEIDVGARGAFFAAEPFSSLGFSVFAFVSVLSLAIDPDLGLGVAGLDGLVGLVVEDGLTVEACWFFAFAFELTASPFGLPASVERLAGFLAELTLAGFEALAIS